MVDGVVDSVVVTVLDEVLDSVVVGVLDTLVDSETRLEVVSLVKAVIPVVVVCSVVNPVVVDVENSVEVAEDRGVVVIVVSCVVDALDVSGLDCDVSPLEIDGDIEGDVIVVDCDVNLLVDVDNSSDDMEAIV